MVFEPETLSVPREGDRLTDVTVEDPTPTPTGSDEFRSEPYPSDAVCESHGLLSRFASVEVGWGGFEPDADIPGCSLRCASGL
jgi:hypothetical protein